MTNLSKKKRAAVPIAFCLKHHHMQWHWMYQLHHHRMTWIVSRILRKIVCYHKSKWSWELSDKPWMQVIDRNPSLLFRVLACLQLSTSGECFLLSDVIPDLPEGFPPICLFHSWQWTLSDTKHCTRQLGCLFSPFSVLLYIILSLCRLIICVRSMLIRWAGCKN